MASTRAVAKQSYSPKETKLLRLLSSGRPLTSKELSDRLYENDGAPYHAQSSVTALLRSLIRKVEYNGEPFVITKSTPSGPHPLLYSKKSRRK